MTSNKGHTLDDVRLRKAKQVDGCACVELHVELHVCCTMSPYGAHVLLLLLFIWSVCCCCCCCCWVEWVPRVRCIL